MVFGSEAFCNHGVQCDVGGRGDIADTCLWELRGCGQQRSAPSLPRQRACTAERHQREVRTTDTAHTELVCALDAGQRLESLLPKRSAREQRPAVLLADRWPGAALTR